MGTHSNEDELRKHLEKLAKAYQQSVKADESTSGIYQTNGEYVQDLIDVVVKRDEINKERWQLEAKLEEIEKVKGYWHGADDEEFAESMNGRVEQLKSCLESYE